MKDLKNAKTVKIGIIKLRRSVGQFFCGDDLNLTLLWLCVIVKVNVQILVEKHYSLILCPLLLLRVAWALKSGAITTKPKS